MKRSAEKTKELIFLESMKQFAEKGYDGVRMDEIANTLGINKATIYYHFKDKQTIYEMALEIHIEKIIKTLTSQTATAVGAEAKLKIYIMSLVTLIYTNRNFAKIMIRESIIGGKALPLHVKQKFTQVFKIIYKIVEEGVKEGVFIHTDPMFLHMAIVGTLNLYLAIKDVDVVPMKFKTQEEINSHLEKMLLGYIRA